jgi:hypothetical protein
MVEFAPNFTPTLNRLYLDREGQERLPCSTKQLSGYGDEAGQQKNYVTEKPSTPG